MSEATGDSIKERRAVVGDTAALTALWQACGLTVWYNDPAADIARFLAAEGNAAIILLEETDRLLGSVCACHDGHRGWVYYLAVHPQAQGRGLGARLMRAAEAFVKASGIPKIQLMIRPTNGKVAAFYRAIGYEEEPRRIFKRWLEPLGPPPDPMDGKLETVITYLEMRERPALKPVVPATKAPLALLHVKHPSVAFYRFLYNGVGRDWIWWVRRSLSDAALAAEIQDPQVEIYVLYCDGQPAGYAELDRRVAGEVELAYFGIMPDFIGKRFGPYLLTQALELAWQSDPSRVLVNTCTLDHPKALPLYQRFGFVPYRQETVIIDDPRANGTLGS